MYFRSTPSVFQSRFCLFPQVSLPSLSIFIPFLNCVALFSFIGHTIITPVLFCPFIISLSIVSTLYFYAFISASLQWFPSFSTHSYAIFCFAWRIHLACGRSGSDGYISWEGGCLVNRYLLVSTMGSMRADADFPPGWTGRLGQPTGVLSRCVHTPRPQPRLAGTHAGTRRQPAPAGVTVDVCLVRSLVSPQTAVIVLGSSHRSKSPSWKNRKNCWHLSRQDSCGLLSGCDRTKQSQWPSTCCSKESWLFWRKYTGGYTMFVSSLQRAE